MDSNRGRSGRVNASLLVVLLLLIGLAGYLAYVKLRPAEPAAGGDRAGSKEEQPTLASGADLYANHCAACHGDKGDGNGPAARFLYPRPRNFGTANFRLVSSANRMPTDADLMQVVTLGMPGSAMFPFGHLDEAQRQSLVAHVRTLMRSAVVEKERQNAAGRGQRVDDAELAQAVDEFLRPDDVVGLPSAMPPAGAESVARGRQLYLDKGCASCHGPTGLGDGVQDQKNDDGMPTRPRDFTRGIFKGGRDPAGLFARIRIGMPGSPMPGSSELSSNDIGDMIHFVLSLSSPDSQPLVEHRRTKIVVKRSQSALGDDLAEEAWQAAPAVRLTVSPLWWRNYPEPDLHVAALHDGQSVAIRLTWKDETRNDRAGRTEDFEDMAAMQLHKGSGPEPFLGMGALPSSSSRGGDPGAVDLWQWRASWQRPRASADSQLDDYPFDMPLYRDFMKGKEAPDFLTARAAGNPHAHATPEQSAASLAAKGFGSTTFRPKASQVVTARAAWKDGRWTVVLRRPLAVGADDGISLAPGERCSIAFAVWDGEVRDRNGQKLVSIWHDLELE